MGKIQVLLEAGVKRRKAADIAQVTGVPPVTVRF
jgi:hypothetical protein